MRGFSIEFCRTPKCRVEFCGSAYKVNSAQKSSRTQFPLDLGFAGELIIGQFEFSIEFSASDFHQKRTDNQNAERCRRWAWLPLKDTGGLLHAATHSPSPHSPTRSYFLFFHPTQSARSHCSLPTGTDTALFVVPYPSNKNARDYPKERQVKLFKQLKTLVNKLAKKQKV